MELFDAMLSRKSVRDFTEKQVSEEQLNKILVAASLAPLGVPKEGKPHLTVVQDSSLLKALGAQWGAEKDIIYGAPTLIIVSHPQSRMAGIPQMNAACVIENMALAATDLGLGSIYLYGVTMGLEKNEELCEKLGIPKGMSPLSALAVGYGKEAVAKCKEAQQTLTVNRV
ncbi:MAG: nitroreductase family protein [Oscillospiraceae bacterium]